MVLLKKPLGKVAPYSQSLADLEQTFSMRRRSCDSIMLLFYRHSRYHKLNEGVGFFFEAFSAASCQIFSREMSVSAEKRILRIRQGTMPWP